MRNDRQVSYLSVRSYFHAMKAELVLWAGTFAMSIAAQPPMPFPDGDVHWTVNNVIMGSSEPSRIYATMGDSTFNGWTYQKIGWAENTGLPWEPSDLTYSGSIRDEGGRWLFVPSGSIIEYPLFDFTGDVGGTVTIENPLFSMGEVEYVIQSITEIAVQNGTRRVWELFSEEPIDQQFLIEGIGSPYGLFGHSTFIFDAGEQLICMEQNGDLIYRIPEAESCYYLSTAVAERTAVPQLQILPNPATDRVTVEGMNIDLTNRAISIHDQLGRNIEPSGRSGYANAWNFDVSGLPDGIYTVSLAPLGNPVMHARLLIER